MRPLVILATAFCALAHSTVSSRLDAVVEELTTLRATLSSSRVDTTRVHAVLRDRADIIGQLVTTGNDSDLLLALEASRRLVPSLRSFVSSVVGNDASRQLLEQREYTRVPRSAYRLTHIYISLL